MFATHSPRHSRALACVLTAALLGPNATFVEGAKETFDVRKPHVNVSVLGPQNAPSPLVIDVALHSDGRLQGSIALQGQGTRVEGTHSAIQATSDGLSATLGTRLQQPTADGSLASGTLTVQVQAAGRPVSGGIGGDIIVFDIIDSAVPSASEVDGCGRDGRGCGGGGDIIVWDIVDSVANREANLLEITFQAASSTDQLSGEPASFFNAPGRGANLVGSFPIPPQGERITAELTVRSSESGTQRPIVRLLFVSGGSQ